MQTTPPVADIIATLNPAGSPPQLSVSDTLNNFVIYDIDLYDESLNKIAQPADDVNSTTSANTFVLSPANYPGVPPVNQLPGKKVLLTAVLSSPTIGAWAMQLEVSQDGAVLGNATLTAAVAAVPEWATGFVRVTFQ